MAEHVIKLPDVGEGVAEAELVEWHVAVGDVVREDQVMAAVMTDKATVEIPSPVEGEVTWLGAEIGATIAIGSPIVKIEVAGSEADDNPAEAAPVASTAEDIPARIEEPPVPKKDVPAPAPQNRNVGKARTGIPRSGIMKPLASPAIRLRAKEAGVDLRQVGGTGPAGRITHDDLDAFLSGAPKASTGSGLQRRDGVEEVKLVGLRRRIAGKMALAKSRIPHITYVEEVDVTALEELRARLNGEKPGRPKLTLLPFLIRAMVRALEEQPALNATFDDEAGIISRHAAIHIGIATQTAAGLIVPVLRHAEARDLFDCAAETARLAEAARDGSAARDELSGSTITITSLGAMGGVATTPVINHPEVAIIGVNKIMMRPLWDGTQFVPRKMMNLSSSFDHRVIDGWDAAVFVQRIKAMLETPALIFIGEA